MWSVWQTINDVDLMEDYVNKYISCRYKLCILGSCCSSLRPLVFTMHHYAPLLLNWPSVGLAVMYPLDNHSL